MKIIIDAPAGCAQWAAHVAERFAAEYPTRAARSPVVFVYGEHAYLAHWTRAQSVKVEYEWTKIKPVEVGGEVG